MANTAQARKRARQNVVRRARNTAQRSSMRTSIKKFIKAVQDEDTAAANDAYRDATATIDRAARRGLQHPNKAARLKSRLNARLKGLATA